MLMATWDGAGNFPPERALVHALATRGHALVVLGHLSQRDAVEADGVTFLPPDRRTRTRQIGTTSAASFRTS